MIECKLLEAEDCTEIVNWNTHTDAAFLQQWAGKVYNFPLTKEQIINRIKTVSQSSEYIYKVCKNNEIIGTIELTNIDYVKKECKICRFLIKVEYQNKGYGKLILADIIKKSYKDMCLDTFYLSVFDQNLIAITCYQHFGFLITGKDKRQLPNGNNSEVFNMVYHKK